MEAEPLERAQQRLAEAAAEQPSAADVAAALERARSQVEELALGAAEVRAMLPDQVAEAVREGMHAEALPVARQLAEVRGLAQQVIRRLEQLEAERTVEHFSRVDDLGLLVDLIVAGWRSTEARLERIERALEAKDGATVHRLSA